MRLSLEREEKSKKKKKRMNQLFVIFRFAVSSLFSRASHHHPSKKPKPTPTHRPSSS